MGEKSKMFWNLVEQLRQGQTATLIKLLNPPSATETCPEYNDYKYFVQAFQEFFK